MSCQPQRAAAGVSAARAAASAGAHLNGQHVQVSFRSCHTHSGPHKSHKRCGQQAALQSVGGRAGSPQQRNASPRTGSWVQRVSYSLLPWLPILALWEEVLPQ